MFPLYNVAVACFAWVWVAVLFSSALGVALRLLWSFWRAMTQPIQRSPISVSAAPTLSRSDPNPLRPPASLPASSGSCS
jgi:hypothetical protein